MVRLIVAPVFLSFVVTAVALTGCSSSDYTNDPAPLAIPPDYTLRPPRPGMSPAQLSSPNQQPQDTIFRAGANTLGSLPPAKSRSPGETALLYDAGAQNAPSNIRQLVNNDNRKAWNSATLRERLLTWHPPSTAKNSGSRPTIEPTKSTSGKGFFGWL